MSTDSLSDPEDMSTPRDEASHEEWSEDTMPMPVYRGVPKETPALTPPEPEYPPYNPVAKRIILGILLLAAISVIAVLAMGSHQEEDSRGKVTPSPTPTVISSESDSGSIPSLAEGRKQVDAFIATVGNGPQGFDFNSPNTDECCYLGIGGSEPGGGTGTMSYSSEVTAVVPATEGNAKAIEAWAEKQGPNYSEDSCSLLDVVTVTQVKEYTDKGCGWFSTPDGEAKHIGTTYFFGSPANDSPDTGMSFSWNESGYSVIRSESNPDMMEFTIFASARGTL